MSVASEELQRAIPPLEGPIRVGVIGCGDVARVHYLPGLADLADPAEIRACVDPRRSAA